MLPGKARILQELRDISRKWLTSRDDSIRLVELLRELAHLDGFYSKEVWESSRWAEERTYGLEEIARLESQEAVSLLVNLWKRQIGINSTEVIYLLQGIRTPAAISGLKELAQHSDLRSDREAASAALQRKLGS